MRRHQAQRVEPDQNLQPQSETIPLRVIGGRSAFLQLRLELQIVAGRRRKRFFEVLFTDKLALAETLPGITVRRIKGVFGRTDGIYRVLQRDQFRLIAVGFLAHHRHGSTGWPLCAGPHRWLFELSSTRAHDVYRSSLVDAAVAAAAIEGPVAWARPSFCSSLRTA